jgi:ferredoxin/flavodoxin---NADP+ reductase
MRKIFPVHVTQNKIIAPNAWLLTFPRFFDFIPGQVMGITLNSNDEPRLYSIASGNNQDEIWILYTKKPDGLLTPPLSVAQPGDTILITEPFGNFICKEEKAIWIATGTGIAPFASMIFSGHFPNKTLIQGHRSKDGLYFMDLFEEKMGSNYHPCCSREPHDGCFDGRVSAFLEKQESLDPNIPYYLCGVAEMVVDVRDLLISRGVPYNKIMAEIFF